MSSCLVTAPLRDECLYSVAAHHTQKWFSGTGPGAAAILGHATTLSRDLVGNLDKLAGVFSPSAKLTGRVLALRHTALPIHFPFFDSHISETLLERACSGRSLQLLLGVAPSRITCARALRICPQCFYEDRAAFGRSYWHREHQLAGVLVCPSHNVSLISTNAQPEAHRDGGVFLTPSQAMWVEREVTNDDDLRLIIPIAQDMRWLLDNAVTPPGCHNLGFYYRKLALAAGFEQSNGSISISRLRHALEIHYGHGLLERIGCRLSAHRSDWLASLLRKPRAHQQPLRHLLLLRFFGISIAQALSEAADVDISQESSGPHKNRIKCATRLSRLLPLKRDCWLNTLAEQRGSARERAPTLYCWLWRNDREWLRQHRQPPSPREANHQTWERRDEALAAKVAESAQLLRETVPLVRASRSRIAARSGHSSWLSQDHPMLPRAVAAIKRCSETAVEFALRRISEVLQQQGPMEPWRLRVRCGISVKLAQNPAVVTALADGCRQAAVANLAANSWRVSA